MLPRAAGVCFVLWLALLVPTAPTAQGPGKVLDVSPSSTRELREWDTETAAMIRSGDLEVRQIRADTLLPGRMTRRADQVLTKASASSAATSCSSSSAA